MQSDTPAIDREKTCPFLLRCFWKANRSGALLDYKGVLPANEVQIYTWRDATLGEIGDLLKDAVSSSRERNSAIEFSFSLVYPDKNGTNMMKKIGRVVSGRTDPSDSKTLVSLGFEIGDYLDVAVHSPQSRQAYIASTAAQFGGKNRS